jgi:UDP-N-acetylmuramate--alanine ligase
MGMIKKGQKVHLVGIKGVAMTALAQILKARGVNVTGSDGPATFFTDAILRKLKIPYTNEFSAAAISKDVDMVISSAAYLHEGKPLNNIEVQAALRAKIPTYTYPEVMSEITKEYRTIGVAGSHGKSTTTALLGWVLTQCGIDPTVIVGSRVNGWGTNARVGTSRAMVLEADEYREAFLQYSLYGAIITSIDYDHPDYFKSPAQYVRAFKRLISVIQKKGFLVVCGDDGEARAVGEYAAKKKHDVLTYGFAPSNAVVLSDGGIAKQQQVFHVLYNCKRYRGTIPFAGKQYVLNSGAAFAVAVLLGVSPEKAIAAMATFPGTARRLETVRKEKDYVIIDDYAHHPTAIAITLEGVRALYPKHRIVAVFQPHMFSRTPALLEPFAKSFAAADEVGIMEIYPSARETTGPVNGRDLAARTKFYHHRVTYLPTLEEGRAYVKQRAKNKTIIVLMGAGNVGEIAQGIGRKKSK